MALVSETRGAATGGARRWLGLGSGSLGRRRVALGWLIAFAGPTTLSLLLVPSPDLGTLSLEAMGYLALTVLVALVGGLWPALTAAVLSSLMLNWFFTPPERTLTIADPVNVVALAMFLLVAVSVASVVDTAARRSVQADLARREADTLTALNQALLREDHDVPALLGLVCSTFDRSGASLLRRPGGTRGTHPGEGGWRVEAAVGRGAVAVPEHAGTTTRVTATLVLALSGEPLAAHERRVLEAFATHLTVVLDRRELAEQAAEARRLEEGTRVRDALLAAVSHDLRTPLAGIKAAVSSLRSREVSWSETDRQELLASIEAAADRLHTIVANLLDLSRLRSGSVALSLTDVGLDEMLAGTVAQLSRPGAVELRLAPDLPAVHADAGLLDRVLANVLENAVRHSPDDRPVLVTGRPADAGRVQLHVVDRGPGVPDPQKARMFDAFQRLGDSGGPGGGADGLGLGLAVARGLAEALGGRLTAQDTPGGGLTMVLDLPVSTGTGPA